MVAIFIESTGMHEKPKMAHVMEDGSAERFTKNDRNDECHSSGKLGIFNIFCTKSYLN
jgi:hypothetical protein